MNRERGRGGGGLSIEGDLLTLFPGKGEGVLEGGGLFERGSLIENLW